MSDLTVPGLEKIVDVFFEKLFSGLRDIAGYQLDKITYTMMCKEAYNNLQNLDQVKTINDFDESVSLYDFYVAPELTAINSNNKNFVVKSLEDFSCSKKILISGIVGQGKSILMKHLAIVESYKGEKFPVFTELRELEDNESLESFMRRSIKKWLNIENDKVVAHLIKEGKVIFFFDGFDEVKINQMAKIVKDFEKISSKFPGLDFIVSSRPEETIDKSIIFNKFLINKLNLDGQLKIIDKLVIDTLIKTNLENSLRASSKDIQGVLVTPLMVNFYYYLYKTEQIAGCNIKLFYDKLFDLTLRKHDGTKLLYNRDYVTKLSPEQLELAFECVCYMSCRLETFFLAEYKFREIVEKTILFNKLKCSIDDLIRDFTTGICFIYREGQSYAFLHTSIAEYFAAKFIIHNSDMNGIYDDLRNNYKKYTQVIKYIKIINEKVFYINFLEPIIDNCYDFFKSKEILTQMFYSLKNYNRKYSQIDADRNIENKIYGLIIFDSSVHPYFAFDFMHYIEPIFRENLDERFCYATGFEIEALYNSSSSNANQDEGDKSKSENYYLYENIDDTSEHGTRTKQEIKEMMTSKEYVSLSGKHKNNLEKVVIHTNLYTQKLDRIKNKINELKEVKSLNDLF